MGANYKEDVQRVRIICSASTHAPPLSEPKLVLLVVTAFLRQTYSFLLMRSMNLE